MDIHQLKTFVAVAQERSITRASERLHLSQPAVSAHVKAMEDALGLALFERTSRGVTLTADGERLLAKAERTLAAHRELVDEATRIKGQLTGRFRIGAGSNSDPASVGKLLGLLSERHPGVEVVLEHGTSLDVRTGIKNGTLDAGFYNEPGEPEPHLATVEVSEFRIHLVAAPGLVARSEPLDWKALGNLSWIYPTSSACCGQTAESLFAANRIRPKRIVSVDREDVTRTLVAGGTGVGLLHEGTAKAAQARGEVDLLFESRSRIRVLFAHATSRAEDPLILAATALLRTTTEPAPRSPTNA